MKTLSLLTILALCTVASTAAADEIVETLACSHWACVCSCTHDTQGALLNPETNTPFFYPGGIKAECKAFDGTPCQGKSLDGSATLLGKLNHCEWTLVPDTLCETAYDEALILE